MANRNTNQLYQPGNNFFILGGGGYRARITWHKRLQIINVFLPGIYPPKKNFFWGGSL